MVTQKSVPLTTQHLQSAGKYYILAKTTSSKHHQNDKQPKGEGTHHNGPRGTLSTSVYTKKTQSCSAPQFKVINPWIKIVIHSYRVGDPALHSSSSKGQVPMWSLVEQKGSNRPGSGSVYLWLSLLRAVTKCCRWMTTHVVRTLKIWEECTEELLGIKSRGKE